MAISDIPQPSGNSGERAAGIDHGRMEWQRTDTLFQALLEAAPDAIVIVDRQGTIKIINRQVMSLFGYSSEECIGQSIEMLLPESVRQRHVGLRTAYVENAHIRPMGQNMDLFGQHKDGRTIPVEISLSPVQIDETYWIMSVIRDITERRKLEQTRQALQEQTILAQKTLLHEVSTPLFPIYDDVVFMPLIGAIDTQRAQQFMETLLHGISKSRSRFAIIDIAGVPIVDTQVAYILVQAANAARLLGTTVILTGIRPEIAQSMVGLGINLDAMLVHGSLKEGLMAALNGLRNAHLATR